MSTAVETAALTTSAELVGSDGADMEATAEATVSDVVDVEVVAESISAVSEEAVLMLLSNVNPGSLLRLVSVSTASSVVASN